jgi:hypothetical protein
VNSSVNRLRFHSGIFVNYLQEPPVDNTFYIGLFKIIIINLLLFGNEIDIQHTGKNRLSGTGPGSIKDVPDIMRKQWTEEDAIETSRPPHR